MFSVLARFEPLFLVFFSKGFWIEANSLLKYLIPEIYRHTYDQIQIIGVFFFEAVNWKTSWIYIHVQKGSNPIKFLEEREEAKMKTTFRLSILFLIKNRRRKCTHASDEKIGSKLKIKEMILISHYEK